MTSQAVTKPAKNAFSRPTTAILPPHDTYRKRRKKLPDLSNDISGRRETSDDTSAARTQSNATKWMVEKFCLRSCSAHLITPTNAPTPRKTQRTIDPAPERGRSVPAQIKLSI